MEDIETIKKMYGSKVRVEPMGDYYRVFFTNSLGVFKFLVMEENLHHPFGLTYEGGDVSKVVELLQEV